MFLSNLFSKISTINSGNNKLWMRVDSINDDSKFSSFSYGDARAISLNKYPYISVGSNYAQDQRRNAKISDRSWKNISVGADHVLALDNNNSLWVWGNNNFGQLGTTYSYVKVTNPDYNNTSKISKLYNNFLIKTDGTLWSWGNNYYWQLGNNKPDIGSPCQVGNNTDWNKILYSGDFNTLAIKNDGSLWAWGCSADGSLGIGEFNYVGGYRDEYFVNRFLEIGNTDTKYNSRSWTTVSGAYGHASGIKSDGSLWTWGPNFYGNLGDGYESYTASRSLPIQVGKDSWMVVSSGGQLYYDMFNLGVKSDGTLWSWGGNWGGKLGLGDYNNSSIKTDRSVPTQIGSDSDWKYCFASCFDSYAIKTDGTLWSWGWNYNGASGLGDSFVERSSPTLVSSGDTIKFIDSSFNNSYLITDKSTLFAYGDNSSGQLGQSDRIHRSTLVQIGTTEKWISSSSGYGHVGALISQSIPNSILGAGSLTPSTTPTVGSNDDGYWTITLPWSINYFGTLYSTIYLGTNGYITFGSGDTSYSGLSFSFPALPKIMFCAADRSAQRIYYGTEGTSPNSTFRVRYEGHVTYNGGVLGSPTIEYEFIFYENDSSKIDIQIGINQAQGSGISAFCSSTSSLKTIIDSAYSGFSYYMDLNLSPGSLYTWGSNDFGQLGLGNIISRSSPVQVGGTEWIYISFEGNSSSAIKSNKTLWAWGSNYWGSLGLGDQNAKSSPVQVGGSWASVSSGKYNSLGIKIDGSLWSWGNNSTGALGQGDKIHRSSPVQVGTSSWTSVSSGYLYSLAIKSDGSLWGWGDNNFGQLGLGDIIKRSSPVQVGTSSWTSVSVGYYSVIAKKIDGTIWTWGRNHYGQLGQENLVSYSSPVQVGTSSWTSVSSGGYHTLALKAPGILYACGNNSSGQLGQGDIINRSKFVAVSASGWKYITGGRKTAAAITQNGDLYTWGYGGEGSLGLGNYTDVYAPARVGSESNWKHVSIGYNSVGIKNDGTLWVWGSNDKGALGLGDYSALSEIYSYNYPIQLGTDTNWKLAAVGNYNVIAVKTDGTLWAWGNNYAGVFGIGESSFNRAYTQFYCSPIQIGTSKSDWVFVAASGAWSFTNNPECFYALDSQGKLWGAGRNNYGELGQGDTSVRSPRRIGSSLWKTAKNNQYNGAGIKLDNTLWVWGDNCYGQLGQGDNKNSLSPIQYGNYNDWIDCGIADYVGSVVGIRSDGSLWGSGYILSDYRISNDFYSYKRSIGTLVDTSYWSDISTLNDTPSTIAIKSNGTLWAWGYNSVGALGLGDRIHRSSPVQVGTSSWTSVSSTDKNHFAIKADGTLWAWGNNFHGTLGQGDTITRSSPVQVGGSWISVSGGNIHVLAIRTDGTLWAWGYNNNGRLGLGDTTDRLSPVQVGTSSWISVSSGFWHGVAIKLDGSLWAWGYNLYGGLGQGNTISYSSPVQVGTSSWTSVSSGVNYTLAIQPDGTLWGWGNNTQGQLGQGDINHRSSPVQVGTSLWSFVFAEGSSLKAIRADGTLWAWGYNGYGQLGQGDINHRSSPVQIGSDSNWQKIKGNTIRYPDYTEYDYKSRDRYFSAGIKNNGELWTIGKTFNDMMYVPKTIRKIDQSQSWTSVWASSYFGGNNKIYLKSIDNKLWMLDRVLSNSPILLQSGKSWTAVSSDASSSNLLAIDYDNNLWRFNKNNPDGILEGLNSPNNVSIIGDHVLKSNGDIYYQTYYDIDTYKRFLYSTDFYGYEQKLDNNSWTSVSAGYKFSTAIRSDGSLWGWGGNGLGQLGQNNNITISSPVQIGAVWDKVSGGYHSLAIKFDGSLWSWGRNTSGQLGHNDTVHRSSPTQIGTNSWNSISSGLDYTVAIDSTKYIYSWGNNDNGQLGLGNITNTSSPTQLYASNEFWTSVSAGNSFSIGIKSDGTLWSWGSNFAGVLGLGEGTNPARLRSQPTQIGFSTWTSISSAASHSVAIRSDGTVWMWGSQLYQILNSSSYQSKWYSVPTLIGTSSWIAVTAGGGGAGNKPYSLGIRSDGTLWGWGSIDGIGSTGYITEVNSPVSLGTWSKIYSGEQHIAAIKSNGTLWTWGYNNIGQLGQGNTINYSSPVQVGGSWSFVAPTRSYTVAIKTDGTLWAWGNNSYGQLGQGNTINYSSPVQVGGSWTFVSSSGFHVLAKKPDGTVWAWGNNPDGRLGQGVPGAQYSPVQIGTSSWAIVTAGRFTTMLIDSTGSLFVCGRNLEGQLGLGDTNLQYSLTKVGDQSWTQVSSSYATYGIRSDGTMWSWGENWNGILGLSTSTNVNDRANRSSPTQIGTSSWSFVSSRFVKYGEYTVSAIRSDGTMWTWGDNSPKLGLGPNPTFYDSPVQMGASTWNFVDNNVDIAVAIKTDGTVWGWGLSAFGQLFNNTYTDFLSPIQVGGSWSSVSASVDNESSLGIKSDGTLWAWGSNGSGQLGLGDRTTYQSPVQVGTSSWTSISMGADHSLAIKQDGTLWSWGYNFYGTLGQGDRIHRSSPVQVGTSSWSFISAGNHSLAIKPDGTLWAWGRNNWGQLGQGNTINYSSPVQVGGSWTTVKSTLTHSLGIRSNGTLWAWGYNNSGQLGLNDNVNKSLPTLVSLNLYNYASAGDSKTSVINTQNKIFVCGYNSFGELGTGDRVHRSLLTQLGTSNWSYSSHGFRTSFFIKTDGTLWASGDNSSGQLGQSDLISRSSPIQVGASFWTLVSSGYKSTYSIKPDNTLWVWGDNTNGQLGLGDRIHRSSPVQVGSLNNWSSITTGKRFRRSVSALKTDGSLWVWGDNTNGQLGLGDLNHRSSPVQLASNCKSAHQAEFHQLLLNSLSNLYASGYNTEGQLGQGDLIHRSSPVQVGSASISPWGYNSSKYRYGAAIKTDGSLWTWGDNGYGQLGHNDRVHRSVITQLSGNNSWSFVATSIGHTLAVRIDGTLWTWGKNLRGQLGHGDTVHRSSPVQVGGSWISVDSGDYYSAGVKSDGTLWAWGDNAFGQLGQGASSFIRKPIRIGNQYWKYVSSATSHAAAVKTDGTLWVWGSNNVGQLGLNDILHRSSPVQISGSWNSVYCGDLITAAIKTDGTLWTWGWNDSGVLGQGNRSHRSSPTQVGGSWTFVAVPDSSVRFQNFGGNTGLGRILAIKSDGTLWSWGANSSGQLGLGDYNNRSSPVQVGGSWSFVSTNSHTLAIRTDGTLWAWGSNGSGQLGLGDNTVRLSPVQVGTSSWSYVSASANKTETINFQTYSGDYSSGITSDGFLFTWGAAAYGQLGNNTSAVQLYLDPQKIGNENKWVYVKNNKAIKSDGTLWAWGRNSYGQLGRGDYTNMSSPVQVGDNSSYWSYSKFNSSANITPMFIQNDGSLWGWGINSYANSTTNIHNNRSLPLQIGTDSNWSSVRAGSAFVWYAKKVDGTFWAIQENVKPINQFNSINYSANYYDIIPQKQPYPANSVEAGYFAATNTFYIN